MISADHDPSENQFFVVIFFRPTGLRSRSEPLPARPNTLSFGE
jgi:hypothetical protein